MLNIFRPIPIIFFLLLLSYFFTISINFYLPSNIIHTDNMELILGIRTETSYNIKHCYYATSFAISLSVRKQKNIFIFIWEFTHSLFVFFAVYAFIFTYLISILWFMLKYIVLQIFCSFITPFQSDCCCSYFWYP